MLTPPKTKLMACLFNRTFQMEQIKSYEREVTKNSGAVTFKRGKDAQTPNRAMKSTKEPHVAARKTLPNNKHRLNKNILKQIKK